MKKNQKKIFLVLICLLVYTQIIIILGDSPYRSINLITSIPNIKIIGTQEVDLELKITNDGEVDEIVDLIINGSETWDPKLVKGKYIIKSVYLNKNDSILLNFELSPPSDFKSGNYSFEILAISQDRLVRDNLIINIELTNIETQSEITMTTPYPSLEGTSNQEYEFRLQMRNRGSEDRIIEFSVLHPENWRMIFNPIFEDRIINSLEFGAGEPRDVMVTVTPAPDAEPGIYNLTIFAISGELLTQLNLQIKIVGTHLLEFITPDGRVSFDSIQGESSQILLNLENIGTAKLEDVHFKASKPVGWEINFEPNAIESMSPGSIYEVRANVIPASDAIPGDYVLTITSIVDPWVSETLNFRTTVRGSVSWGFIGIGFIGIVSLLIFLIFKYFGRR